MATNQLPRAHAAEMGVLGSILIDRDALLAVAPMLQPDDFYDPDHRSIYTAMLRLYERRMPPDLLLLYEELSKPDQDGRVPHDELEKRSGARYLARLMECVPTSVHANHYASQVRQAAHRRRLMDAAAQIAMAASDESTGIQEVLRAAYDAVAVALESSATQDPRRLSELIEDVYDELDGDPVEPVKTGLLDLDGLIGGFFPKQLIIIAARPSIGKSALMAQITHHNTIKKGREVGLISLEMSGEELAKRFISIDSHLDMHRITAGLVTGNLTEGQTAQLSQALGRLHPLPVTIDDASGSSLPEILARAKAMHARYGLDLLFVDYLQLMDDSGKRGINNRVEEISQFTRAFKRLARELEIPVVVMSQLSRALENRADPRPRLSDLRESGSIEQDADMVLFIHRPDRYTPNAEENVAELIVAKNRNGPANKLIRTYFHEQTATFRPLTQHMNGMVA